MARCLDQRGGRFSIPRCGVAGPDAAVGAVRASIGLANNHHDIHRALDVVATFAL